MTYDPQEEFRKKRHISIKDPIGWNSNLGITAKQAGDTFRKMSRLMKEMPKSGKYIPKDATPIEVMQIGQL